MDFEKIKTSIGSSAEDVFRKTEEFISTSKLNFKISDKEEKIQDLYIKMGEKIYKKYEGNTHVDDYVINDCKDIKELLSDIEIIKNKILALGDKRICSKCGNEINKHDPFCPYCGVKQEKWYYY